MMNTAFHLTQPNTPAVLHTTVENKSGHVEPHQACTLRAQAFSELQQSIQSYNDAFVLDMRYQEERRKRKQHGAKKMSSNDKGDNGMRRSREARMMDELAVIFQAGSLQDYTPVLEWESKKNMPDSEQLAYEIGWR